MIKVLATTLRPLYKIPIHPKMEFSIQELSFFLYPITYLLRIKNDLIKANGPSGFLKNFIKGDLMKFADGISLFHRGEQV